MLPRKRFSDAEEEDEDLLAPNEDQATKRLRLNSYSSSSSEGEDDDEEDEKYN